MATRRTGGAGRQVTRPHGQMRRSQLVGTAGPGALLDLPRHAVLVSGLDFWGNPLINDEGFTRVEDERVRARLAVKLKIPYLQLFAPPVEGDTFGATLQRGIKVFRFPEWFIAHYERPDRRGVRPLVRASNLEGNRWLDPDRKKRQVVPVRFVRACSNGHLADIDWVAFAHRGDKSCKRQLWWAERGASGDFVDIFVECECGKFTPRPIIEATKSHGGEPALGFCYGKLPWLGRDAEEKCESEEGKALPMRLLVRNASNAYFGLIARSISLPEPDQDLRAAVSRVDRDLQRVTNLDLLQYERGKAHVQAALGTFSDERILEELQRRRDPKKVDVRDWKVAELETFLAVKDHEGSDSPDAVFFAREQKLPTPRPAVLAPLTKVLRVERLREVSVQVGFTRFEAPSDDVDGALDLELGTARLAREVKWLPAVENRGEGLFFSFDTAHLKEWVKQKAVKDRKAQLAAGAQAWAVARKLKRSVERPVEYVLLHSLSHLLLNQLALECGYAASSLRERVYFSEQGAGILLMTASPDAEGTLGGLANSVRAPGRLEQLFRGALQQASLCSNDPICSAHRPDDPHEERFLQGAACHGCLLLPETSCEARNDFLDRALVVETLADLGGAFFGSPA